MLSAVRRRFSYANVAVTFVLVFAMSGGAFAAGKYLITSTKQISPKVLKALRGKPGVPGAVGAQGPAGPAGVQGLVGSNGKNGAPGVKGETGPAGPTGAVGTSVTSIKLPVKSGACPEGGSEFTAAEGKKTTACNGAAGATGATGMEGSPWTAGGTLPKGSTEKGVFSIIYEAAAAGQPMASPISFTIPLVSEPAVHYLGEGAGNGTGTGEIAAGSNKIEKTSTTGVAFAVGETVSGQGIPPETTIIDAQGGGGTVEMSNEATETNEHASLTVALPAGCKGSGEDPEASEGVLCIFAQREVNTKQFLLFKVFPAGYAQVISGNGGMVHVSSEASGLVEAAGSWAVTG